ncbi:hypothetical protein [Actinokineospora bangkokensis]|uniref:Secreted protein n=1 Tax=Actinokineospora bangkokensis TaxID=1193682 RepID=A0A1Q9LFN3_9PSEU|nr:hypothetical protein [Actinokineospora bangkokensis]OLR90824.1 hypothetical protein BJP25_30105 [Actinokineospora bangkokensis]
MGVETVAAPDAAAPSALRRVARSATTTPGRLSLVWALLLVLTVVTGVVGALAAQDKQDTLDELVTQREPLTSAAQQVFRSLSDADATAASAFLSGGVEPPDLRARYEADIAQAGDALAAASADVGADPVAAAHVSTLSQQLPVYTGLVETARANNRQGFPAGAAYLREASGLMRSKLLTAAEQLYGIDYQRLRAAQDEATAPPWGPLALAAALLLALGAAQRWLTRRTNRLLNVGMLVATGAVVVAAAWSAVVLLLAAGHVDDARRTGSGQADVLVHARINALKARADETLTLVARGDGSGYEQEWRQLAGTLVGGGSLLEQAGGLGGGDEQLRRAEQAARGWADAHTKLRGLDDGGQYEEAVEVATGESATAFAELDDALREAIDAARADFATQTGRAAQATTLLAPGLGALAVVAAAGISAGIRQRLREYR